MKKTIVLAYFALILSFLLPYVALQRENFPAETAEVELQTKKEPEESPAVSVESVPAEKEAEEIKGSPAPEKIRLLLDGETREMDMQTYLIGVVAAEMPADFEAEALKAQAVAARSFAIYCMEGNKHQDADVCADYKCCQAYISEDKMRENWGENFPEKYKKIASAVSETEGEYLSYEGKAVFAAFHSSSSGFTEDCKELWSELPYLKSVKSPESEKNVPGFVSTLHCAPIDFRDCLLSKFPEADFTGEESSWIGKTELDESGRVKTVVLGGVKVKGTELRELFSLRSTAFSLEYAEGKFVFTVKGFGHGVGMSQYGAKILAHEGKDYISILAHYYPGTSLTS